MAPIETGVLELQRKKIAGKEKVKVNTVEALTNEKSLIPTDFKLLKENTSIIYKLKKKAYFITKRLFDILCSLIGCCMIIPVAIIVKICYLASGDKKSIFYSQKRIGLNGKEFNFYKFRSMVHNADEVLEKLLKENEELANEYKMNKKLENDPRITKVGNFLRKTSLDELPQFINVLKGEMSVIGNRPYLPREKVDMGVYFDNIVRTKCGIVSLWAIEGRSGLTFEERLQLENYYSNFQSLKLDLKIFIRVFAVVLLKKGAK